MKDGAVTRISVAARPERCYEVAVDFDRYTRWATALSEVEVLERDGRGRGTRVRFAMAALGRSLGYVLDYDYAGAPATFSWTLAERGVVRVFEGCYRFDPGPAGTDLGYRLTVDLAVPLPGFVKRRVTGMIVQNALAQFKGFVESGS